ncbi:MAG: hypothetical protein JW864_12860 [Spirochaetes bacterium]|nr:hypothetical protein [Spirochaetota bacterium]
MNFVRHTVLNRTTHIFLFTTVCIFSLSGTVSSQESYNFSMTLKNRILSITAQDADIKNILSEISDITGISVSYPKYINKKVTTRLTKVPLPEALKSLLRGMNYTVIYSYLEKKDRFKVSEIYVLPEYSRRSAVRTKSKFSNTERRIQSYERRIRFLTERMEKLEPDSPRRRTYERRLRNYQNRLDRLRQNH